MGKDVLELISLCVFALMVIALLIAVGIKIFRNFQPAREKRQSEERQSKPPEPVSTQRANLKFIAVMILIAVVGALMGFLISLFSNLVYIVILFPVGMGLLGGSVVKDAVRVAKVRKIHQLILMSLLMAVTIYGTYHYGRYVALQVSTSLKMFPGFSAATEDKNLKMAQAVVDYALKQETGHSGFIGYMLLKAKEGVSIGRFYRSNRVNLGPLLTWFYWLLEFGIILWAIFSLGKQQIVKPFCEFCGSWRGREKHLGGTTAANESLLLDLIKQRDFSELGKLMEKNADLPSTEVYLQGCDVCTKGPSRLIVRRAFQTSKGLQFVDAAQTVLPPEDGVSLLDQLRFVEN